MKPGMKKILYAAVALAALAGIGLLFVPSPVAVDVAMVERGPLMVTVDEDGETRARDRFEISAPVAGRVSRIQLLEGDPVDENQVVAELWPLPLSARERTEQLARIASAEAMSREAQEQVRRARAEHAQATRELARVDSLVKDGFVSPQAAEQARVNATTSANALEAARFRARAASAELRAAKAALLAVEARPGEAAAVKLRSPVSGRVLRIRDRSERVVAAGAPLMVLGDPKALEIVIDVLSSEAVRIRPGMAVLLEGWGGDEPLRAQVRLIEPYAFTKVSALGVEEQRVNVIADFVDPPGPLGDAYRVEARVILWQADDVLKVPVSALFRHADDWAVFVIADGRARLRAVRLGRRATLQAEVSSGLQAGEPVIVHPPRDIGDGARVSARSTQ